MAISLAYGHHSLCVELADAGQKIQVLAPQRCAWDPIRLALAAPIGSPRLCELVRPSQSVAIVASDITRPCPTGLMLPPVLEELAAAGVREKQIAVVFALGSHRPHTAQERARLAGSGIAERVRCLDSDPSRVVQVGTTSRGTPIEAFEPVVSADVRIALGNVEPHYFAGYSGGAKALVPGVCSARTIQRNHAWMVDPQARGGVLAGNPVREDLEEGAALIGIDFILNVILDNEHRVVAAAAGDVTQAHRWACRLVEHQSTVYVDQPADVVLVSSGGYPKDISLYQAQKALDNAAAAVRPGGVIVWAAECPEGLGHATFEEWIVGATPDSILARLQHEFVLGGHKAAAIARVLKQASVHLVSSLPPELVRACGLAPFADVDSALAAARKRIEPASTLLVLPEGASVLVAVRQCQHSS
jgi:nickel-dependent lactate racemase